MKRRGIVMRIGKVDDIRPYLIFQNQKGMEILRITEEGEVYYMGRKVTSDKQIEIGLKDFLIEQGYYK